MIVRWLLDDFCHNVWGLLLNRPSLCQVWSCLETFCKLRLIGMIVTAAWNHPGHVEFLVPTVGSGSPKNPHVKHNQNVYVNMLLIW